MDTGLLVEITKKCTPCGVEVSVSKFDESVESAEITLLKCDWHGQGEYAWRSECEDVKIKFKLRNDSSWINFDATSVESLRKSFVEDRKETKGTERKVKSLVPAMKKLLKLAVLRRTNAIVECHQSVCDMFNIANNKHSHDKIFGKLETLSMLQCEFLDQETGTALSSSFAYEFESCNDKWQIMLQRDMVRLLL